MHPAQGDKEDPFGSSFFINDRIFLGEGLFETLQVSQYEPCHYQQHWQRLKHSSEILGLDFTLDLEQWHERLRQKIQADQLEKGGIKAILTGGQASRGLIAQGRDSQLLLQTFSYSLVANPLKVTIAPWLRDPDNPVYGFKSINYLESILARRTAASQGFDEVLFMNTRQNLTEASCANLFILLADRIMTPPLTEGVLAGITRQRLIDLCQKKGIPCEQSPFGLHELKQADAVFLSNSLQGIQVVSELDGLRFKVQHPLLSLLIQALH